MILTKHLKMDLNYRTSIIEKNLWSKNCLTPTKLDSNKNQETYNTSLSDHTTGNRLKTTWNWRFFLASSLADELAEEFPESSSEFETSSILATPASPKLDFVTLSSSSSFADLLIISNCGWNIGFTSWTDFGKNWSVDGWDGCHAGRDSWLTDDGTSWLTEVSKTLKFKDPSNRKNSWVQEKIFLPNFFVLLPWPDSSKVLRRLRRSFSMGKFSLPSWIKS